MGTGIEWCDEVWNPVTGCTPISEGCANCYAGRFAKRLAGRSGYPEINPFQITFHEDRMSKPLRWRKPRRIFVCSMGDLFHEDVEATWLKEIVEVFQACQEHTFLVLTKRPENFARLPLQESWWPLPNVWLGVTVENQERADQRIPLLLELNEERNFISVEPMLGPINLEGIGLIHESPLAVRVPGGRLGWVICGAETGPGKRWMNNEWARALKEQCDAVGIPFFFKKDSRGLGPEPGHWREIPDA